YPPSLGSGVHPSLGEPARLNGRPGEQPEFQLGGVDLDDRDDRANAHTGLHGYRAPRIRWLSQRDMTICHLRCPRAIAPAPQRVLTLRRKEETPGSPREYRATQQITQNPSDWLPERTRAGHSRGIVDS